MDWISVKQKLPEFNVEVWAWVIYSDGNERGTETWLEHPDNREFGEWAMGSAKGYRVTHWMPLPDPPVEPRGVPLDLKALDLRTLRQQLQGATANEQSMVEQTAHNRDELALVVQQKDALSVANQKLREKGQALLDMLRTLRVCGWEHARTASAAYWELRLEFVRGDSLLSCEEKQDTFNTLADALRKTIAEGCGDPSPAEQFVLRQIADALAALKKGMR